MARAEAVDGCSHSVARADRGRPLSRPWAPVSVRGRVRPGEMLTLMLARVVAVAVSIEALLVAGYGLYLGVSTVTGEALEPLAAIVMALTFLALAAGLVVLARGVLARRRWAAAPVIVWQILQAAVAVQMLSLYPPIEIALLALCLIAGVGVLVLARELTA